ncbi:hypothetical protein OROMI_002843 [Orobanche minor]
MEPSVPAYAGRPITAVPISEHPLLPEEMSAPSAAYLEAMTVAHAETSRKRLFLAATRRRLLGGVRLTNPDSPPMVVDFLADNLPQEACDVPQYVNWAFHNLMRAWTINLDEVARDRSPDVVQALFALALQTAMMAAQVVRDFEERPSTAYLQADLEAARKRNAELADKLAAELVEARRSGEVALKEVADRKQAAIQKVAAVEGKSPRATEELAAKAVELDGVTCALAGLMGEIEAAKLDTYSNVEQTSEFAYYMAYTGAIRVAKGSGLEVSPLVEAFKAYVPLHPLNPIFVLPILGLSMEYVVDLSWYLQPDRLADTVALMNTVQGESVPEGGGWMPILQLGQIRS